MTIALSGGNGLLVGNFPGGLRLLTATLPVIQQVYDPPNGDNVILNFTGTYTPPNGDNVILNFTN